VAWKVEEAVSDHHRWELPNPSARIGVLNNPRAGRNPGRLEDMRAYLNGHPDILHVETETSDHVPDALQAFRDREIDILVVNGGDGTLQRTLTMLLDRGVFARLPLIVPLRGGTTNQSALDMGCQRNVVRALDTVIRAVREGALRERMVDRSVMRVEFGTEHGERSVQFGMFCGLGVLHRAVELVHRAFPSGRRSQGVLGAGLLTGWLVARSAMRSASGILAPDDMDVRLDDHGVAGDRFQLAIATTLDDLFLRIRPFWGMQAAPVRVTTIAFGASRIWASAVGILRGRPAAHVQPEAGYTSQNVHRAEFRVNCGLTVDGEVYPPQQDQLVRIEADQRLRFVRA
jgi:diacylglycerol kinase family enzyme